MGKKNGVSCRFGVSCQFVVQAPFAVQLSTVFHPGGESPPLLAWACHRGKGGSAICGVFAAFGRVWGALRWKKGNLSGNQHAADTTAQRWYLVTHLYNNKGTKPCK
ncbi:hypothetical protein J9253_00480 [Thiothrix litoralis]|uniref:Uncharacterized protein n=1 Tax=Thiothrix litoralis TaxID=2891210 RepID=A0ABX7WT92_9GAMM|nr:hypothetical protein [Thiothrix litoralis]QTR46476.1 hypothetical protein J9253_00480 [Thiothrix litoralis]